MSKPSDYRTLLRELTEGGVELIIVGALAAVLQGAPIVTFDLDILQRRLRGLRAGQFPLAVHTDRTPEK